MAQFHENLITADEARTLDGLFARRVHRSAEHQAYQAFDRERNEWVDYTWGEMATQVARWQAAMTAEGLMKGDRVALQLRNGPEWVIFEQAALSQGLVVVPLYTDDRPDNVAYILQETAVKLLLVQDVGRWKRLATVLTGEDRALRRVLLLDDAPAADSLLAGDERLRLVNEWLPLAPCELQVRKDGDPMDLASIVFTSGTTGRPKGVMLSHNNILSNTHTVLKMQDCYQEDVFLSFLPLSHMLERTAGYYVPMLSGAKVAYARSVGQLAQDLKIIRPTVLISVPRIFERVYGKVQDKLAQAYPLRRALFDMAVAVGWSRFLHQQGRSGWSPKQLMWPVLERLVAGKLLDQLGGRLRAALCGGAPLSKDIARVFIGLGLPVMQGYGLTETSPVISVNLLHDNIPESVGVPLRNVEVRIGEQDELQVRGPAVMMGYWNNHAATTQMIDADGWLHTGDQARIDEQGHLHITGRIKDILVLSNGEKIPPADMEQAIALDPMVEQVMVVGEGRSFLTALVVLNAEHWPALAQEMGFDLMDAKALRDQKLHTAALKRITNALHDFPGYAKIRRVHLTLEPWTVDNGLLTPTMKVKRPKVLEHYATEVEAMYG